MKKTKLTLVGCLMAGVLPSQGVERPAELNEKPHELQNPAARDEGPVGAEQANVNGDEKKVAVVEAMPVAEERPFLGVGSEPIDQTLSMHLGLEMGLVVRQVQPGSGAANAGLKAHDILLTINGQKVGSPVALRDAVAQCQVGQQVPLEILREGQHQNLQVTLTARPAGIPGIDAIPLPGEVGDAQIWPGDLIPHEAKERLEELGKMLDEQMDMKGLGLKLNEIFEDIPKGGGRMDVDLDTESTVTWADADGDITMTMKNNKSEVKVRDREGKVVFHGPWDTEADKAAVDPEIRRRIEGLDVKRDGNQLRFWMDNLPGR